MDSEGGTDPGRAPTIYDGAKAAGAAPSTVPRSLARPWALSSAAAGKRRAAAATLG